MALKFNPFEKDKAAPTPKARHSHFRVFDDPTRASESENEIKLDQTATSSDSLQNGPQTGYKKPTNRPQTDYKPATKKSTKGPQTDHRSKREIKKQTTQQTTKRITTRPQTDHKGTTTVDFLSLVGHERHLLLFIFNECRTTGELVTAPLTLFRIKEELKIHSSSAAKTIISRLINKKFIFRGRSKTGRGGWMTLHLPQETFQRLLLETDYKKTTNGLQTDDKETTKRTTQQTTTPSSSSSSSLLLNTTTTKEAMRSEISSEWENVGIELLSEVGFKKSHLLQIIRFNSVTPEQLQDSIDAFHFDLEENDKASKMKTLPLNYFMGVLRNGPYAPPANYESPKDKQLREYLEAKENQKKKRSELEEKLQTLEFEEWEPTLTAEQKLTLVPATDFARLGSPGYMVQLKEYFKEKIWRNHQMKDEK